MTSRVSNVPRRWDSGIPPLLRPLLRAYILGYASAVGPRLLTLFLQHLTKRRQTAASPNTDRQPQNGEPFSHALRRILAGGLDWQRFPTFCAVIVGGTTLLEVGLAWHDGNWKHSFIEIRFVFLRPISLSESFFFVLFFITIMITIVLFPTLCIGYPPTYLALPTQATLSYLTLTQGYLTLLRIVPQGLGTSESTPYRAQYTNTRFPHISFHPPSPQWPPTRTMTSFPLRR